MSLSTYSEDVGGFCFDVRLDLFASAAEEGDFNQMMQPSESVLMAPTSGPGAGEWSGKEAEPTPT
jgi:hypothetical protein